MLINYITVKYSVIYCNELYYKGGGLHCNAMAKRQRHTNIPTYQHTNILIYQYGYHSSRMAASNIYGSN